MRVHPDDLPHLKEKMVELSKTGYSTSEYRVKNRDGSWRYRFARSTMIYDHRHQPYAILAIIRDITERKNIEEALRKSKEEYTALFANMIDGFAYCQMLFDENGKPADFVYLQINDAFERITGLKRELVVGKNVTEAIPGVIEANPELFEIYGRVALTGKKEKFEVFFKPLSLWLNVSVYSPAKGYFAAVFVDITERKKAEEELKKNQARMEVMNEKLNVFGRLTRHDVGNKLTVVKSNVYLLRKKFGDNPQLASYLEGIDSAISQSDEMFEFSRFYERIGVETPSEMDVGQSFSQAVALLPNLGNIRIVNDCLGTTGYG